MYRFKLEVKKLHEDAVVPKRAHFTDAGLDLFALADYSIAPGDIVKCRTGIAVSPANCGPMPDDYQEFFTTYCQVAEKSGLASKGIVVLGGVIDDEYTGEILVILANIKPMIAFSQLVDCLCNTCDRFYTFDKLKKHYLGNTVKITKGQKMAQLIMKSIELPILQIVDKFSRETTRGESGFGSTGL